MKLLKFLMVAILTTTFFACNDDDADNPSGGILGSWEVTQIDYTGTTTTVAQGVSVTADFTGTGINMDLKINFDENPNEYQTSGDYSIDLTTTVQGQTINTVVPNENFMGSGTWDLTGNTLTFTDDGTGNTSTADIVEMTDNKLEFKQVFQNVTTQQGATVTQNIDATFTFEK